MESQTLNRKPIKFWPPIEGNREIIVERMTKKLFPESIYCQKHALLRKGEAFETAKKIEEACFVLANDHFEKNSDDHGCSAVQLYGKEISRLMIEALKQGWRSRETVFDISGGPRDFLHAGSARELLSPLMEEGNSYTKICFSNRSFGIEAARVAEPILMSLKKQLVEVDLSDFIARRPEDEALEVMRVFSAALEGCELKRLNLSNNAMGEKGVRAFESLLRSQNSLEELYLMNDRISEEAAKALCEMIPSAEKLKVLHFHNNMTGDEGAVALSELLMRSPRLEDFRCSSARVGIAGGITMSESLETCTGLKKLDLRDNLFGFEAGIVLSRTLEKLPGITELYLSYLNLEDEGSTAIFDALKQSVPCLEVLEIAGNEITEKSAFSVADFLSSKEFLKKINLSENELRDEGAVLIGRALEGSNPQLRELDLSSNELRRVGARCLAQAIVSNKPDFVLLNINGNVLSEEGIEEVKEILKAGGGRLESVLGPLDENVPEGEEEEEEDGDEEGVVDCEIQNLCLNVN